ncbi:MAG: hypothetical protein KatS3mg068_2005 [Candidatus Sericytochromatia bacterium]|nr:MAG: hypothetical protein KatS3mg068_2005 [Candidatus Sericytochromatia bacterium]
MLSKAIKDNFLNTYFNEEEQVYITEIYDKWKRKPPKILKKTYTKEDAIKAHEEILEKLEKKLRRKEL